MAGSLAIPTVFAGNSPKAVSTLDTNLSTIAAYINIREATQNTLANRPAAGNAGAWYFATDVNGGTLYNDNGTNWVAVALGVTAGIVYTDQLTGLGLSFNSGTVLNIALGAAASNDAVVANRVLMNLTSTFTKSTAAWVVGTGNGGLATGVAVANSTWYHVFLIQRPDTGVVDIAFDTSVTGANISANTNVNYTKLRRLGSFLTSGAAAILNFTQDGDYFRWAASVLDYSVTPGVTTAVTATLASVPLGLSVQVLANVGINDSAGSGAVQISDLSANDEIASTTAAPLLTVLSVTAGTFVGFGPVQFRVNTAQGVRVRATSTTTKVLIATLGWIDRRGKG